MQKQCKYLKIILLPTLACTYTHIKVDNKLLGHSNLGELHFSVNGIIMLLPY